MSTLSEISENLQKGKRKIVMQLVQQALDEGIAAEVILKEGLLSGMDIIGAKFRNNEVFVPEVLVAARAMNAGTEILKEHMTGDSGVKGKVIIGTVQGDLHDIGKNLVRIMIEGKGVDVVDLGVDVSPEAFVKAIEDEQCDIVCLSALLTTTMGNMENTVKAIEQAGLRSKVKIMVGGAPISQEFADKIGADKYTDDASEAAEAVVQLLTAV